MEKKVGSILGFYPWRRKRQPTPVFLPGKSHRGAWQVTGHGGARVRHDLVTEYACTFRVKLYGMDTERNKIQWLPFRCIQSGEKATSYNIKQCKNKNYRRGVRKILWKDEVRNNWFQLGGPGKAMWRSRIEWKLGRFYRQYKNTEVCMTPLVVR